MHGTCSVCERVSEKVPADLKSLRRELWYRVCRRNKCDFPGAVTSGDRDQLFQLFLAVPAANRQLRSDSLELALADRPERVHRCIRRAVRSLPRPFQRERRLLHPQVGNRAGSACNSSDDHEVEDEPGKTWLRDTRLPEAAHKRVMNEKQAVRRKADRDERPPREHSQEDTVAARQNDHAEQQGTRKRNRRLVFDIGKNTVVS